MSTDPFGVVKAYELHEHSRKQNAAVGAGVGAGYGGTAAYVFKGPINRGAKNMAEKGAKAKWAGGPRYAKVSHLARNASTPGEAAAAEHAMKKIRAGMSGKQRAGLKAAKYISNPRANKAAIITGIVGGSAATVGGSWAAKTPKPKKAKVVSKAFSPIKTGKNLAKYGKFAHKVLKAPTSQVPVRDKATLLGMAGKKMAKDDPVGAGLTATGAVTTGVGSVYGGHKAKQQVITKSKNITYHETAGVRSRRTVRAGSTAAAALGAASLATPGGRRFASGIGHVATKAPEDFKVARTASGFRRDLGLPGMSRMAATKQTAQLAGRGVKRVASQDPIPAALATGAGITGGAAGIAATKSRYHGRQEQKLRRKRKVDVDKSAFGVDHVLVSKLSSDTKKRAGLGATGVGLAAGGGYTAHKGFDAYQAVHNVDTAIKQYGKHDAASLKTIRNLKAGTGAVTALGAGTALGGAALAHHQIVGRKKKVKKSAFGVETGVDKSFRRKKDKIVDAPNAQGTGWTKQHLTSIETPLSIRRQAAVGAGAIGAMTGLAVAGPRGAVVGGAGGAYLGHRGTKYGYAKKKPERKKKKAVVKKSAFGIEHVSKAKSETGLLGNASGPGGSLLHSGRGSDSKLLHDGKGSGKALLHDGKGTLIKTGLGRATIDTRLGAK